MKKLNRNLLFVSTLSVAVGVLGACSAGTPVKQEAGAQAPAVNQKKEPVKITMLNVFYEAEAPKKDNPILLKVQEHTNTELTITWVPSSAYNDKVATMMAANDLPKVLMVTNDKDPLLRNSIRSGMFWELGPYLKSYPNLGSKLEKAQLSNSSVDGKTFGLYRTRDLARRALIYRQDWMENLGMKEPQNLDEVYNLLKAFTFNDPDRNGKDDTIGLVDYKGLDKATSVAGWFGAPNAWSAEGTPDFATDAYMNMLNFYKKLYDEKILNQDFGIMEESQKHDSFMKGKAGAKLHILGDLQDIGKFDPMFKLFPTAKIDAISRFSGNDGNRSIAESGYTGIFLIPKTTVKTEEELKQILTYFDKLLDKDMQNLLVHGVEGVEYKVVDGKAERLKPEDPTNRRVGWELGLYRGDAIPKAVMRAEEAKANKMLLDNEKVAVVNPFAPLDSATYLEKGAKLQKGIDDAKIKFIMGVIDDKGWKAAIEQWRKDGGDKMIEEYKAEYAKLKK
ncbi:extracellular solute-binding protein [Paenibacillus agricola]|uniref:Extracellular solute-binding protein n=1 Tax=Paenibacillus agricola TaxID=2716264 RepID=A0ABX0J2R1_9BACL|nr:extracellular solute-binding protein [Paenibacillus agricola]NHN29710.1 extracellular solute-binding protein [Paenibacillus agricola]